MNPETDTYATFAIEHGHDEAISEQEQQEAVTDFIVMSEDIFMLHAENIATNRSGMEVDLSIEGIDGSELLMRVGEHTIGQTNEPRQRYISFALSNFYGRIDDTYIYKLSEGEMQVHRQVRHDAYGQSEYTQTPVGKSELQKIQALLLLGKPRAMYR